MLRPLTSLPHNGSGLLFASLSWLPLVFLLSFQLSGYLALPQGSTPSMTGSGNEHFDTNNLLQWQLHFGEATKPREALQFAYRVQTLPVAMLSLYPNL